MQQTILIVRTLLNATMRVEQQPTSEFCHVSPLSSPCLHVIKTDYFSALLVGHILHINFGQAIGAFGATGIKVL